MILVLLLQRPKGAALMDRPCSMYVYKRRPPYSDHKSVCMSVPYASDDGWEKSTARPGAFLSLPWVNKQTTP